MGARFLAETAPLTFLGERAVIRMCLSLAAVLIWNVWRPRVGFVGARQLRTIGIDTPASGFAAVTNDSTRPKCYPCLRNKQ